MRSPLTPSSLPLLQVYYLPYRLAAKYPKTRIGQLATYTDHSRKLDLCDDYVVQSNEFFFDRDPKVFHNIFNFYRLKLKCEMRVEGIFRLLHMTNNSGLRSRVSLSSPSGPECCALKTTCVPTTS